MSLPLTADGDMDDLPRTLRREKEARLREAREREAQAASGFAPPQADPLGRSVPASESSTGPYPIDQPYPFEDSYPAAVRSIDVPFFKLMMFFIKAVFAAIPAIIILGVILWFAGQALEAAFPELLKMKILITFPNS